MGKPSKRPGRDAWDVHAIIRGQAVTLNCRPPGTYAVPADMPEVNALLVAAMRALEATPPPQPQPPPPSVFVFSGRFYWLRVEVLAKLEVFDSPRASAPLVGVWCQAQEAGHVPGH